MQYDFWEFPLPCQDSTWENISSRRIDRCISFIKFCLEQRKREFQCALDGDGRRLTIYKPGMTGSAEVVTENLRLIERIFNSIRKIFER